MNILEFQRKCDAGEKLVVATAYDYAMALAVDAGGVDAILVGDSLSTVMLGRPNTLSATMDEMIHHCKAVARGTRQALLIGDMPFLSYQGKSRETLKNAGRFMKEGGAHCVKLEWGVDAVASTQLLVGTGIPVMGHIGFTPQHLHRLGGYRKQGKDQASARLLLQQAKAFEKAGAFSIVLELIPPDVAKKITRALRIPTIGIGAGPDCDGQVQVLHDLLGLLPDLHPKHAKAYLDLHSSIQEAVENYARDVRQGRFAPGS
jgi:3-methyl-2-oxobutanoate hydroxymethyltransferase